MEKFGAYAFNKSHSVAYSVLTARTAWLSKYYPVEFMTATLNSFINNIDKIKQYLSSCRQKGITVLGPSVSKSAQHFTCGDGAIRFGLEGIKGLGSTSALIVRERDKNGPFKDYQDLLTRMATNEKINKKAIEALIYSGALDEFSGTRKEKIDQLEVATGFVSEIKEIYSPANLEIMEILNIQPSNVSDVKLVNKDGAFFSKREMLNKEFEYTSFYITGHPMDDYADYVRLTNTVKLGSLMYVENDSSLVEKENGQKLPIKSKGLSYAGVITEVEEKISKKGNQYANVSIEDKTGRMSVSFYAANYEAFKEFIVIGNCVSLKGKVQVDENGAVRLIADDLQLLDEEVMAEKYSRLEISKRKYADIKSYIKKLKKGTCKILMTDYFDESNNFELKGSYDIGLREFCELQELVGAQNIKKYY